MGRARHDRLVSLRAALQVGRIVGALVIAAGVSVFSPSVALAANRVPLPRNCSGGAVALTFDDGPTSQAPMLVRELLRYRLHATFFDVGEKVAALREHTRDEARHGFMVENHTYTHRPLAWLSPAAVTSELVSTQTVIQQVTGVRPVFYRPPYGVTGNSVRAEAAQLGLTEVLWTVDTLDYPHGSVPPATAQAIAATVATAKNGDIVLMHDAIVSPSIDAIPVIAAELAARNICTGRIIPTTTVTYLPNGEPDSVTVAPW